VRWVESDTWARQSYTMMYLEYKVDQVDLTNPFHNLVRNGLVKRQNKKDKTGVEGFNDRGG
jgi:hypothetical protein